MAKFFGVVLTITLLAFANLSQAQTPQPTTDSQKPDISDGQKKTKIGRRTTETIIKDYESRLKQLITKIDYRLSGRKSLPFRVMRARGDLAFMDYLHGGLELSEKKLPAWWRKYQNPKSWPTLDYSPSAKYLQDKWIPRYKIYLKKKFGSGELSPETLRLQVWNWLLPREKAERQAKVTRLEKELARDLKSIRRIRDRLVILKDKRIRKEDIEKYEVKREEQHKPRKEDRRRPPKPKAEEDRIVEADEGGMLVGKSLKLSDLDGCGAVFLGFNPQQQLGHIPTPCPGLTGGRVATQADYLPLCNSLGRLRGDCGPPGPGTEKRIELSGIQGMPFSAFCLGLHYNTLGTGDYNSAVMRGNLQSIFKYDNGSRRLECYYISKAQAKALYEQSKGIGPVAKTEPNKDPSPAKPVARAEPKKDCKPGGGLVGGVNCVTERIDPPDTVNPTGNRRPRRNNDGSPAFASSTDPSTGETITSVGNSDGSRTVTKTDKDGNILSREKVR